MVTTRTSLSSQSKARKNLAHPKERHLEGAGKTAKPKVTHAEKPHGTHEGKTPKHGRSGGAFSVKNQGGHVATNSGAGRKKKAHKTSADKVAAVLHRIR